MRGTSVFVNPHGAVSVGVVDLCSVGTVDGYLEVVGAKAMAVGVGVGE